MVSDKSIIAVVDDEWSVRTMLGRVLRLAGYRVAAFSSGEDFMTSLATRLPECAIVDIHMPRMSGFDVQTRLLGAKRAVPVIFITASDDETLDAAARQLNVTACCESRSPATRSLPRSAPSWQVPHWALDHGLRRSGQAMRRDSIASGST